MEIKAKIPSPLAGEGGRAHGARAGEGADEIIRIARSWIGTPYVHQASVKGAGCDCLGLLRGVWRELRGDEPETPPPYSPDWAEASGAETLYAALARHMDEIAPRDVRPGDVALFRMAQRGPAKHCGIIATQGGALSLIHARGNKRVSEELFTPSWKRKCAFAFRI
jgi:NlpC/P60 family putative phage cell wall peptidase